MQRTLAIAFAFHALAAPLAAQDEAALRTYFEGRTVMVKVAMPATEAGIDVYPGTPQPIDYPELAKRMKKNGVAIQPGQPALVTKLKVKGNLIEFQLDGGGYGTAGDPTDPTVSVQSMPKTQREKDLEQAVKKETDPTLTRRLQGELDGLRSEREREDRRNRAIAATATERKREYIQERRLQGGSRFNLRYRDGVPSAALTVEAVKAALADYVDFEGPATAPAGAGPAEAAPPAEPQAGPLALRKGMAVDEADRLLGAPASTRDRKEGTLAVNVRTYDSASGRVRAEFVEGVLVRFTITSR
jgi:hypothetical protein